MLLTIVNVVSAGWVEGLGNADVKGTKKKHRIEYRYGKCTLHLYSSGAITCTGAKTEEESIDTLMRGGYSLTGHRVRNARVVNVVAKGHLGDGIHLSTLYDVLSENDFDVRYEPEMFCAVVIRNEWATSIVFESGSCMVMGAKSVEDVWRGVGEWLDMAGVDTGRIPPSDPLPLKIPHDKVMVELR